MEHIIKINAAGRRRIVVQLLEANQISVKLTAKYILKWGSVDQWAGTWTAGLLQNVKHYSLHMIMYSTWTTQKIINIFMY